MWAVIKIEKKKLELLKNDLKKKFGDGGKIYFPKLLIKRLKKKLKKKK